MVPQRDAVCPEANRVNRALDGILDVRRVLAEHLGGSTSEISGSTDDSVRDRLFLELFAERYGSRRHANGRALETL